MMKIKPKCFFAVKGNTNYYHIPLIEILTFKFWKFVYMTKFSYFKIAMA